MSANDRQEFGDHYQSDLQHWDVIERHGVGYLEGCATKYITRWRKKNGVQDLLKAKHYVEKLRELHADDAAVQVWMGLSANAIEMARGPRGRVPDDVLRVFALANELQPREATMCRILMTQWDDESLQRVEQNLREMIHENT